MGNRFNRPYELVFMAVAKPVLTEFGVHYRLESCDVNLVNISVHWKVISLKY